MLTLFTIPKAFTDHMAVIQRNAIQSWMRLQPCPEIILFGDDQGTAEVAEELGVRHIPQIGRNEYGTPLVNDVFEKAQRIASHDVLCYVNADIMLLSDFVPALEQVVRRNHCFLVVGQRWDIDVKEPLDLRPYWEEHLRTRVAQDGRLHPQTGIDYFVFTRGLWGEIPPFAIGRTAWDNWLLYRARARSAPLIDATQMVMVVHQNHGYAHIPDGVEGARKGAEAKRNLELTGGYDKVYHLQDANWLLTPQGLIPAPLPQRLTSALLRRVRHLLRYPRRKG